jgi:hypothetical protein
MPEARLGCRVDPDGIRSPKVSTFFEIVNNVFYVRIPRMENFAGYHGFLSNARSSIQSS